MRLGIPRCQRCHDLCWTRPETLTASLRKRVADLGLQIYIIDTVRPFDRTPNTSRSRQKIKNSSLLQLLGPTGRICRKWQKWFPPALPPGG